MSDGLKIFLSVVAVALAAFGPSLLAALRAALPAVPGPGVLPPAPPPPPPPPPPPGPSRPVPAATSFSEAFDALAVVRNRLVKTGCLDEAAAGAVGAITHALVEGTDK